MKKQTFSPNELDLFQLAEAGRELEERKKTLEDSRRKAEVERSDIGNTLPPSDVVTAIRNYQRPAEAVSRIEVRNVRREQGKALLLLALLIAITATFIWLGFKLMQGG